MSIQRMNLAEAIKKFEPDSHTAGFVSDGKYAAARETVRYYFKDGREMFFHSIGINTVVVVNGTRDWHQDFIDAYNWVKLNGIYPQEDK